MTGMHGGNVAIVGASETREVGVLPDRSVLHTARNGVLRRTTSAGRQGPGFAARVNSFNWSSFYDRLGGGVFIEAVKGEMVKHYDYVLVDSRTGLSDTAGICSVQLLSNERCHSRSESTRVRNASAVCHCVCQATGSVTIPLSCPCSFFPRGTGAPWPA